MFLQVCSSSKCFRLQAIFRRSERWDPLDIVGMFCCVARRAGSVASGNGNVPAVEERDVHTVRSGPPVGTAQADVYLRAFLLGNS